MRVGFHAPFLPALGGGEKVLLTLLEDAVRRGHEVTLLAPGPTAPAPEAWERLRVEVEAGSFAWVPTHGAGTVTATSADLDLLVALTVDVPPLSRATRSVAIVQFPLRRRTGPRGLLSFRARRHLRSYDRFLVYSRWVAEQASARLGVNAAVLAPPVHGPANPLPVVKDPAIVAVGRFFPGGHDKRHDVLIEAFRTLAPPEPWTLHLVGGVLPGDAGHLAALRKRAAGLRVQFHPNAPASALADLQARSALAWHAAGFGVGARHPERLEHFGIAVAEAMANGAVVLAHATGGPAEIITDGDDGRLWLTVEDLVASTTGLIDDPSARERMARAGRASAARFAPERFLARAASLVFEG